MQKWNAGLVGDLSFLRFERMIRGIVTKIHQIKEEKELHLNVERVKSSIHFLALKNSNV